MTEHLRQQLININSFSNQLFKMWTVLQKYVLVYRILLAKMKEAYVEGFIKLVEAGVIISSHEFTNHIL